jgi:fructose-1,6-bisphosphatase
MRKEFIFALKIEERPQSMDERSPDQTKYYSINFSTVSHFELKYHKFFEKIFN